MVEIHRYDESHCVKPRPSLWRVARGLYGRTVNTQVIQPTKLVWRYHTRCCQRRFSLPGEPSISWWQAASPTEHFLGEWPRRRSSASGPAGLLADSSHSLTIGAEAIAFKFIVGTRW